MKITAIEIKPGMIIEHKNDYWNVLKTQHVKPGKGPAFVRTKMKSVTNGKVIDNTFSAGHKIEEVRVETHKFQYLYNDGDTFHFMNTADYSQIELQKAVLDNPDLMKEGEVVTLLMNTEDNSPLSVDLPSSVILEVTSTEPGIKGNTATNATKPATVETGATVMVPLFINEGDKIKVETAKGTYKERIKA